MLLIRLIDPISFFSPLGSIRVHATGSLRLVGALRSHKSSQQKEVPVSAILSMTAAATLKQINSYV